MFHMVGRMGHNANRSPFLLGLSNHELEIDTKPKRLTLSLNEYLCPPVKLLSVNGWQSFSSLTQQVTWTVIVFRASMPRVLVAIDSLNLAVDMEEILEKALVLSLQCSEVLVEGSTGSTSV